MTPVRYGIPAQIAAMDIDQHHVVEASAGTGKTYLIERRVVDILLRGRVPIDRILLVTFTEKATAELRRRVRSLIRQVGAADQHSAEPDQPHWLIDHAERKALRTAVLGFDQAAIHTIHGFCHRVLTSHAFDGGRPFRMTQIATEVALRQAVSDALRDRLAGSDDGGTLLEAFLGQGGTMDGLGAMLSDLARVGGHMQQSWCPDQLATSLQRLMTVLADLGDPTEALCRAGLRTNTARAATIRIDRVLAAYRQSLELGQAPVLDELHQAIWELHTFVSRDRKPELAGLLQAIEDTAAVAVPLRAAVCSRFYPEVQARLDHNKALRGQFDFGDMLELVWRGLEGPGGAELAATLRRRYPHALIDEFQDTDELQWKIFRRLYLEQPRTGCHLTVVGDPKQSIYGFRGADLATFLGARDQILADRGEPVRLTQSYRSSRTLIGCFEHIFATDTEGNGFFTGGIDYPAITSDVDGPDPALTILTLTEGSSAAKRVALAGRIGDEIASAIGSGVPASDIFILTRSTAESRDIAERLRNRSIPCALFQQEGLLQSREATEVLDLLTAIARPADRSARIRAWHTRFFAADLERIAAIGDGDHPWTERLWAWKSLADRQAYEELLSRVLEQSRVLEREIVCAASERALTNYLHLFELVLDEMRTSRCDVEELIRRFAHWITATEEREEHNVQRLEAERDAVQIMTMHRAKGLEAEYVFIYGGDGGAPPRPVRTYHQDGKRMVHVGKLDPTIKHLVAEEEAQDNQRLLYVALTRAARRLYVPWYPAAGQGGRLSSMLSRRLDDWVEAGTGPGVEVVPIAVGAALPASSSDGASLASWRPPPPPPSRSPAALAQLVQARRGPPTSSYTRIRRGHERSGLPPSSAVTESSRLGSDSAGEIVTAASGRQVGIFLHEVLEDIPVSSWAAADSCEAWAALPEVSRVFDAALRRHGITDRSGWHQLVWRALRTRIELPQDSAIDGLHRADRIAREVDFVFPLRDDRGHERALLRGAIDLVFEHAGRVYWLDWKSDSLTDWSAQAVSAHVADHYRLQADIYSLAMVRMLSIHDRTSYQNRFGGVVYFFLRTAAAWVDRPSYDSIGQAETILNNRQVLG